MKAQVSSGQSQEQSACPDGHLADLLLPPEPRPPSTLMPDSFLPSQECSPSLQPFKITCLSRPRHTFL